MSTPLNVKFRTGFWPAYFHLLRGRMLSMTGIFAAAGLKAGTCSMVAILLAVFAPLSAYAAGAATTTTLAVTSGASAVTSVAPGTVVTLTATVGVHPGLVKFCDAAAAHCTDAHLLGTAQLTSAGTATYKFIPGVGKHSYKAVFAGTTTNATSSSAATALTVTGGSTSITMDLEWDGTPGNYILTLYLDNEPFPLPTGAFTFVDTTNGNTSLGTAPLVNTVPLAFTTKSLSSVGPSPDSIVVRDFNNDGIPDVATSNEGDGTVSVLLGKGDGTFTAAPNLFVGSRPKSIAAGDFNGDGFQDLAIANSKDATVSVLLGKGDGTFTTKSTPSVGLTPNSVTVGDFNNDGIPDLATANEEDNTVTVLLGNGDGTFKKSTLAAMDGPSFAVAGDFNGDGIQDIATINGDDTVAVFLSNGDGTFKANTTFAVGDAPSAVVVGDFNGDGILDIATANYNANGTVTVLLGNGDGTFKTGTTYAAGFGPTSILASDFNNDGVTDLIVLGDSHVMALQGNGDGTFTPGFPYYPGGLPSNIAVGDFNGDGNQDFVTADGSYSTVAASLSQFGEFLSVTLNGVSVSGGGTHLVDVSFAGDANYSPVSSNTVSLTGTQTATATSLTLSSSPSTANFGQQVVLMAKLTPYNSGSLTTNTENIVFQSNGTTIGTVPLASGVAVLNITSLPVGTDNITAAYAGDTNFNASTSAAAVVTVTATTTPLTPTLSFAPIANVVNGVAPFTVSATSASSGAVTYAVTSGPATISGATVTVTGVGTVVLSASQAAAGNYTAATTTASFNVTAPVVLDFTLSAGQTQSQTIQAGASATYTLQIAPSANAYPASVTFSASGAPSGASVSFSPTTVAANAGAATVTVTVKTAATMALGGDLLPRNGMGRGLTSAALGMLLLPFAGVGRIRKQSRKAACLLLILLGTLSGATLLTGCGGGSSSSPSVQSQTYNIILTATSGTVQHSTTVTLQVE
jgi:Bacterial Ig-like domain (group 3)/FG-GAP-like repeat